MFKKLRITGKLKKAIAFLAAVTIAASCFAMGASAATADRFEDVNPAAWYYTDVAGAVDEGLFGGVSTFQFKPNQKITRAEFIKAVANLCKANVASYNSEPFTDVGSSHWAYHEIAWAYKLGIVGGVGNNKFAPERQITRAEMCAMLVGGIEKGLKKTLSSANAPTFSDQSKIPSWASTAVKKCGANGIIKGTNGAFNPSGMASRAEAAAVFNRYRKSGVKPLLEVEGFYIDFDPAQDYYLCTNADFDNCKIIKYNGSGEIKNLQVKHHLTNKTVSHKLGDKLNLGFIRAKVTFNIGDKTYTLMLTDPSHNNYARKLARVTGSSVNLRNKPTTEGSTVITTLSKNSWVYFYEKTGNWYRVKTADTGKEGYISASYLQIGYYNEVAMPASYKAKIDALKKNYPNWTFSFVDVEMTYEDALSTYGASNEQYINPVNYLNEDKIFAFLDVSSYQEGNWTADQVKAMWVSKSGASVTRDQFITQSMMTAKSALMNPLYMASRAILESGYGTSYFANGTDTLSSVIIDGETKYNYDLGATYYNFYGIGAKDSNPRYSMIYAKNQNWNTKERALVEGAAWIKQEYLDWGDLTPYFFRFVYKTQYAYMTDVKAPQSEAKILKNAYSDPNAKAHFIVPVYR